MNMKFNDRIKDSQVSLNDCGFNAFEVFNNVLFVLIEINI